MSLVTNTLNSSTVSEELSNTKVEVKLPPAKPVAY
jgi:hypothetical protein